MTYPMSSPTPQFQKYPMMPPDPMHKNKSRLPLIIVLCAVISLLLGIGGGVLGRTW